MQRFAITLLGVLGSTPACVLQGVDTGVCISEIEFAGSSTFCSSYVRYTACVPTVQPGFPPLGVTEKDAWVRDRVTNYTAERRRIEEGSFIPNNPTYSNWSGGSTVVSRFSSTDCANAYRAMMCYLAFPRCDESESSVRVCRSVCENLFRVRFDYTLPCTLQLQFVNR